MNEDFPYRQALDEHIQFALELLILLAQLFRRWTNPLAESLK
jgi:hypothetical protein